MDGVRSLLPAQIAIGLTADEERRVDLSDQLCSQVLISETELESQRSNWQGGADFDGHGEKKCARGTWPSDAGWVQLWSPKRDPTLINLANDYLLHREVLRYGGPWVWALTGWSLDGFKGTIWRSEDGSQTFAHVRRRSMSLRYGWGSRTCQWNTRVKSSCPELKSVVDLSYCFELLMRVLKFSVGKLLDPDWGGRTPATLLSMVRCRLWKGSRWYCPLSSGENTWVENGDATCKCWVGWYCSYLGHTSIPINSGRANGT